MGTNVSRSGTTAGSGAQSGSLRKHSSSSGKKRSKEIDFELQKDMVENKRTVKLLLLG